MAGPLVGGERGISGGFAVVGGIIVLIGTQWLLGKLLPESVASTIAWAALVAFGSRADVRALETSKAICSSADRPNPASCCAMMVPPIC